MAEISAGVKSAVRALEILEFFDRRRREATVKEIATELGYPQSSTSVLLQTLTARGYLARGSGSRTFQPTLRVSVLGSWMAPTEAPSGEILTMMQELGDITGETIILAALANDVIRYVHVVPATGSMRLHVGPGTVRPLATSGAGRVFMSMMSEDQLRGIIIRHNASQKDDASRLSMAAVRRDLAQIKSQRYAISLDRITAGAGVVVLPLPPGAMKTPHALAIGGLSQKMKENCDWYVQLMRKSVRRYLRYASRGNGKDRSHDE
jgi:IclR family acetate operon transcriptional repressor